MNSKWTERWNDNPYFFQSSSPQAIFLQHPETQLIKKTYLKSKVLKFPFSGLNAWFSIRANPKPMTSTERVRVKSREMTKTTAHALNLMKLKTKNDSCIKMCHISLYSNCHYALFSGILSKYPEFCINRSDISIIKNADLPVTLKVEINHLVFDKQVCIKYWMFETN